MIQKQYVPKKNPYRTILIVGGIFLALVLIPYTRNLVRQGVGSIGTGILRTSTTFSQWFSNRTEMLKSKQSFVAENALLSAQILELEARIAERNMLANENAELKLALGRIDAQSFILAAVIAKPPKSIYDTIIIDGGESIGLTKGQKVFVHGRIPIGVIEEVRSTTAVARLYSSPGEKTDVRLDPLGVDITLVGRGGGTFEASVPHDVELVSGMSAISIGLHTSIIAQFQRVTSDSRDTAQTALFASPMNMSELSFVQVLK